MGYEIALGKAWKELEKMVFSSRLDVQFLTDIYEVNLSKKTVLQQPSLLPAQDYLSVLVLHYILGCLRHGYRSSDSWISFKISGEGIHISQHIRRIPSSL